MDSQSRGPDLPANDVGTRRANRKSTASNSTKPPPFISCTRCRLRKVKCTGEKPACSGCETKGLSCKYDTVVKRRGPDKLPGGRFRNKGTFVEHHVVHDDEPASASSGALIARATTPPYHQAPALPGHGELVQPPAHTVMWGGGLHVQEDLVEEYADGFDVDVDFPMYEPPGWIDQARDGWWTWILEGYSSDRGEAARIVTGHCKDFFASPHIWFTFIHKGLFFRSLFNLDATSPRAVHIVLALLAHITFAREGRTQAGQLRAIRFAETSRSIIDHALTSGSKDPTLAQAALLLCGFECQPHILHSPSRTTGAIIFVNTIGHACWQTRMDGNNDLVSRGPLAQYPKAIITPEEDKAQGDIAPHLRAWAGMPAWLDEWNLGEVRKEEMRRMVWTATAMSASLRLCSWMLDKPEARPPATRPEQFALLYPGEAALQRVGQSDRGKFSPYALFYRVLSLWHVSSGDNLTDEGRAAVIQQIDAIQADIIVHNRNGPGEYTWHAQDWLNLVRRWLLAPSDPAYRLRWFAQQKAIMHSFANPHPGRPGILDKPIFAWWYLIQGYVALDTAIEDGKYWKEADDLLRLVYAAIDSLVSVWPCDYLEHYIAELKRTREKGMKAWSSGVSLPPPQWGGKLGLARRGAKRS